MKDKEKGDYGPRFTESLEPKDQIWLSIISLVTLAFGIGVLISTVILHGVNKDISDSLFVVWAAIPIITCAVLGFVSSMTKKKLFVSIFLVLSIFTFVVTGFACVANSLTYWTENWDYIKNNCDHSTTLTVKLPHPFPTSTQCSDLKKVAESILAQASLCAVSCISLLFGIFYSVIVLCCGPWAHIDDSY